MSHGHPQSQKCHEGEPPVPKYLIGVGRGLWRIKKEARRVSRTFAEHLEREGVLRRVLKAQNWADSMHPGRS